MTSAILNDAQISRKNDPPRLDARVSESNLRFLRPLPPEVGLARNILCAGPLRLPGLDHGSERDGAVMQSVRNRSVRNHLPPSACGKSCHNCSWSCSVSPISARSQVRHLRMAKSKILYRKMLMFDGSVLPHTRVLARATLRNSSGRKAEQQQPCSANYKPGVPESSNLPRRHGHHSLIRRS